MPRSRLIRLSLLAVLAAVALGAYSVATSLAGGRTVHIAGSTASSYHFKPKALTVNKGATVHWKWSSNAPHNVTFSAKKHSATGSSGAYKRTFKKAGNYRYLCTVHGFRGKIVVK